MTLSQVWERAFLERRPSLMLGLFRVAVAFTVGCHMIPSFFEMDENFLPTAFTTKNFSFFPVWILRAVDASPAWVIWGVMWLFLGSLLTFAIGAWSQRSAIVMTLCCYYFYALNTFQIGTLSFDILLVTLILMCVTDYHGDCFSADSVHRGKDYAYKKFRPIFLQRLLQLQLGCTFWYTALSKISGGGNWLTENPYFALMHYPPFGVMRNTLLRAFLAGQPELCRALGIAVVVFEFALPILMWSRRTRAAGIALGIAFQLLIWATMHVPTIFLFLFPAMMLLFVAPETVVAWIERRQDAHAREGRAVLLYDGRCGFCLESVKRLLALDIFKWLDPLDFHTQGDLTKINPALTPERCRSEMVLLAPNGDLAGGFLAFRRMSLRMPMLWLVVPLLYLPGAAAVGTWVYRWVAAHRYLLHRNPLCATNQCALPHGAPPPVDPSQN